MVNVILQIVSQDEALYICCVHLYSCILLQNSSTMKILRKRGKDIIYIARLACFFSKGKQNSVPFQYLGYNLKNKNINRFFDKKHLTLLYPKQIQYSLFLINI